MTGEEHGQHHIATAHRHAWLLQAVEDGAVAVRRRDWWSPMCRAMAGAATSAGAALGQAAAAAGTIGDAFAHAPADDAQTTFLTLAIVGEDGSPLAGIDCEIVDAGGEVHRGTTGADGIARVDGIRRGDVEYTLRGRDRDAWKQS